MKIIEWKGEQITKPGVYSKIPLSVYHSGNLCDGPSVSSSHLRRLFAFSPAHFHSAWSGNPDCIEIEDAKHFILGRALHHLVLGEKEFAKHFCAQPEEYTDPKTGQIKKWHYGADVCKEWRDAQHAAGRAIITMDQFHLIEGMCKILSTHWSWKVGAMGGLVEHSLIWKDKPTGLWLKSRPDAIPRSSADFVDLKTTTSTLYYDLQRAIKKFGYHQQAALASEGAKTLLDMSNSTFTFIFIEASPPYCVRPVTPKDWLIELGARQNRFALDTIARCLSTKHWPGPGGDRADAEWIELSDRDRKEIEDRIEFGLS